MTKLSGRRTSETRTLLLPYITGAFVAVLLIQSVACAKMVQIGPLTLAGGTLLFPIVFIFNDILTEVYGFAQSRRVIWTGFAAQALAALTFWVIQVLPPPTFWQNQEAYDLILGATPRIFSVVFWHTLLVNLLIVLYSQR